MSFRRGATITEQELWNYTCSDRGLLLPLINEYTWSKGFRAGLYMVALLYCFLGIALIADIFMCAILKIISKTRTVHVSTAKENEPQTIEVRIWNDTVANLTLMALGSSAPEILLSCIEIIGNGFEAGALGPGTIVGSAAFNLMCITSLCIISIPKGESRPINSILVFSVTSVFSVFAYVWLLVILKFISPNVVELWEAVVTFVAFPVLVALSYVADKYGSFGFKWKGDKSQKIEMGGFQPAEKWMRDAAYFKDGKLDKESLVQFIRDVKKYPGVTDEDAAILAATKLVESQPKNRGWYRISATRDMTGSRKTQPQVSMKLKQKSREGSGVDSVDDRSAVKRPGTRSVSGVFWERHLAKRQEWEAQRLPPRERLPPVAASAGTSETVSEILEEEDHVYDAMNEHPEAPTLGDLQEADASRNAVVEFHAATCAVPESVGKFKVGVTRHGRMDNTVQMRIETIDGSATADSDFVPINKVITFQPNEFEVEVEVEIINDDQWEPDEEFFLKLSLLNLDEYPHSHDSVALGKLSIMEITILNDDDPGTISFDKGCYLVKESCGTCVIPVMRRNGADGEVSIKYKTIDRSAVGGKDYIPQEGTLIFRNNETELEIEIPVINDYDYEKNEHFELELFDATGGASVGRLNRTTVTIVNDDDFQTMMNKMMVMTNANLDRLRVTHETWAAQIKEALNVNGGDIENASVMDYIMHVLTFAWKLLFCLVPPADIWGGWLAFFVSLLFIAILTAIVGDCASIFGCLVGLSDEVTAITFVAMGTSLPDTFASRAAAMQEKYADLAIGNVTGSNSVNVFLGLGLPWLIAAIYHFSKGTTFKVPAGSMGFGVTIFTMCAVTTIGLIYARRYLSFFGKAELGGPSFPKYASGLFIFSLWILYIVVASLHNYGHIQGF